MSSRILRRPAAEQYSGYKHTKLYELISDGLFVPPVRLGPNCVGWPESELAAMNAARIAGKDDDEIRQLVRDLVAARKDALAKVAA